MKQKTSRRRCSRAASKSVVPHTRLLQIDDLSRGGAGVAKDDNGRVIFVPYTAPGDVVKVKIVSQKSAYAQAELLEVVQPSPLRQTPPCPAFGRCGGCDWQHLPYSIQWQTKCRGVEEVLKRFNIVVPAPLQLFPSVTIWSYRNRIQLRGRKNIVGFYARSSHTIVPVSQCAIARPELNAQIEAIGRQGESLVRAYKVELELLPDGTLHSDWNSATAVGGFQQINTEQNQNLKQWVLNNISPHLAVLDLYGGAANLSAQLAPHSPRIDCVDLTIPQRPHDGFAANIHFHKADVYHWIVNQAQQGGAQLHPGEVGNAAIIDPPRGGMPEHLPKFIDALAGLNVRELIAVGCKTDTWGRDLSGFVARGWKLEKVAVFDFFPHTAHVETAAFLRRC